MGSKTKGYLENKELICLYSADLNPVMVDHVPSIEVNFPDGRLITGSINDVVKIFKSEYHLTPAKMQRLREVFDGWFRFQLDHGNVEDRNRSPIFIQDGIVKCLYNVDKMSVEDILRHLRDFYEHAKDPHHYAETMAWTIFAPLHYEIKTRATRLIQAPLIFTAGPSRTGKTSHGDLFIGHGFAQSRDEYFLPYNRVKTPYALMWNLSLSNMPRLIDEVPADFYVKNAANLKAYCQTGIFGDRGRGDPGVIQYLGMCSFITTTNDALRRDDDLALSNRNLIQYFTIKALSIQNKDKWKALYAALPEGFLFALFDIIFGGMAFEDIVRDVENFESSHDWIKYVLEKINMLCAWYGIDEFPNLEISEIPESDNASEIAEAFISEWNRIEHGKEWFTDESGANIMKTNYRSPLDGEIKIDERTDIEGGKPVIMWVINFTGTAFKMLNKNRNLNAPYKTATEFLNNIANDSNVKVENQGKQKMVRINHELANCFQISMKAKNEGE